jgi:phosphohistidine swiveling domain-containing protein
MTKAKKMNPPDYKTYATQLGGSGWTKKLVRRYPGPEKRTARVTFTSWVGTAAIDAKHTHVAFNVEPNYCWTGNVWASLWDDPDRNAHRELERGDSFVLPERALRYALRTMEKRFPISEGWKHVWSMYEDEEGNEDRSQWDPSTVLPDEAEDEAVSPCAVCGYAKGEHTVETTRLCVVEAEDAEGLGGTLNGDNGPVRFLVDAGRVIGKVGKGILILADMQPKHVSKLVNKRALLVEVGGATSHLATVAREMGVTVALVPDARQLYPDGTKLDVDPENGLIVRL